MAVWWDGGVVGWRCGGMAGRWDGAVVGAGGKVGWRGGGMAVWRAYETAGGGLRTSDNESVEVSGPQLLGRGSEELLELSLLRRKLSLQLLDLLERERPKWHAEQVIVPTRRRGSELLTLLLGPPSAGRVHVHRLLILLVLLLVLLLLLLGLKRRVALLDKGRHEHVLLDVVDLELVRDDRKHEAHAVVELAPLLRQLVGHVELTSTRRSHDEHASPHRAPLSRTLVAHPCRTRTRGDATPGSGGGGGGGGGGR
jgi:hypothetical protein